MLPIYPYMQQLNLSLISSQHQKYSCEHRAKPYFHLLNITQFGGGHIQNQKSQRKIKPQLTWDIFLPFRYYRYVQYLRNVINIRVHK